MPEKHIKLKDATTLQLLQQFKGVLLLYKPQRLTDELTIQAALKISMEASKQWKTKPLPKK